MERRGFLKGFAALVGGIALEQAVPLGRVWSFPKEVKCLNFSESMIDVRWVSLEVLRVLQANLELGKLFNTEWDIAG